MNDSVTVVITSCGRIDLLEKTLNSFLKFNSYPIERYLLIDDSANTNIFEALKEMNSRFGNILELHFNYEKLGQVRSVDKMYSMVNTDYIFHCEDDWEFYKSDFIQKSIDVLKYDNKILMPIIRPKSDGLGTGMSVTVLQTNNGVKYRKTELVSYLVDPKSNRWVRDYAGFTLNPGLRRTSDYRLIEAYTNITDETGCEEPVDRFYRNLGFYVVSLSENNTDGYVKHIGWGRTTENHKW